MICNFSVGQFVDVVDGVALNVQGLALHSLLVAEVGGQALDSDGNLKYKQVVLKCYTHSSCSQMYVTSFSSISCYCNVRLISKIELE